MVELWAVRLKASPQVRECYRSLLSQEETARADRFVFDRHREAYELSQGALRMLLGRYLRCRAREVTFTLGEKGKPVLRNYSGLHFNKSHTEGLAFYGFAHCEIGVDVEADREVRDADRIAARCFTSEERVEPFLRVWTRKEALVKAVGGGLQLLANQQVQAGWIEQQLDPDPGFLGAVAYRGPACDVQFHGTITCSDLPRELGEADFYLACSVG